MAPFTFGPCPRCAAETRQRFLPSEGDDFVAICETCFAVITNREDGSAHCRDATDDEREFIPPTVVFSDEQKAEWRASLEQSRTDIRAWLDAGCPGLTPELEQAFPLGWLERVREFARQRDE